MIKFGLILLILFVTFCVFGIIENYDKKKSKKLLEYKLVKMKIYDITCEACGQSLKNDDAVVAFVDSDNKTYISHATCCFVINEEKQIITNYAGDLVCFEDMPKHSVLINETDKKLIEEFIK